jgi:uncharacterized membrane protein YkoI
MSNLPALSKQIIACCLFSAIFAAPGFADPHDEPKVNQADQASWFDSRRPNTQIEFDEDQNEVYRAVQNGDIRPFSELYAAMERDLYGRIIRVELEKDDGNWVYELKVLFDNNVIRIEYDAATLEILEIKGRNLNKALKPQIQ